MYLLIQYGGDLRLHDSQNRTPKTLALFQTNPSLRRKMLAFIEEVRSNAKTQASRSNGNNQMNRYINYVKSQRTFPHKHSASPGTRFYAIYRNLQSKCT